MQLRASAKTVLLWRRHFLEGRLVGIEKEAPRSKRRSKAYETMVCLILRKTKERPANATQWTTRSLAKELGIFVQQDIRREGYQQGRHGFLYGGIRVRLGAFSASEEGPIDSSDFKQHSKRCRWRDDRYPGMRAGFAWPDGDKKASQRRSGQSLFGSVPPRATRR